MDDPKRVQVVDAVGDLEENRRYVLLSSFRKVLKRMGPLHDVGQRRRASLKGNVEETVSLLRGVVANNCILLAGCLQNR